MSLADRIAGVIGARKSGDWWRTSTAHCHGGDTAAGLAFRSPDDDPEKLIVHCYSRSCHESMEGLNRARDNLRAAAGLPRWEPSPAHGARRRRAGSTAPTRANAPLQAQKNAVSPPRRRPGGDTAAYAAKLWAAAAVSTGQAPEHHPVSRWLAHRGLWAADEALPEAVRWLPRSADCFPRGRDDSPAAGALVLAMLPLDDPTAAPAKVQIVAIDAAGRKAQHWQGKPGDKRTYGTGAAYGLLWRGELQQSAPYHLHACEGLADGLRILRYTEEPAVIAVCAGKAYHGLQPAWFASCTLWPDADDDKALDQARAQAQTWANAGLEDIHIARLPAGHDPASAPLTGDQE